MGTFVVMLRSINVGGRNRVAMADLKTLLTSLGFTNVATYLQSGNIVCSGRSGPRAVARTIAGGIEQTLGLSVPVVVRTDRELAGLLRDNPLAHLEDDPTKLHVTFLDRAPDPDRVERLESEAERFRPDRLTVVGADVFLHCPGGYGETRLNNGFLERQLGVTATTRNWRTVEALAGLAGAGGPATER